MQESIGTNITLISPMLEKECQASILFPDASLCNYGITSILFAKSESRYSSSVNRTMPKEMREIVEFIL